MTTEQDIRNEIEESVAKNYLEEEVKLGFDNFVDINIKPVVDDYWAYAIALHLKDYEVLKAKLSGFLLAQSEAQTDFSEKSHDFSSPEKSDDFSVKKKVEMLIDKLESQEYEDEEYPAHQSFVKGEISKIIREIFGDDLKEGVE